MSKSLSKKSLISYRGFHPDDLNFILATWLKCLYSDNDWFHQIQKKTYFTWYEAYLKKLLTLPETHIVVACLREDPTVILAYAVLKQLESGHALHWAFCKLVWRRIGIMKEMLEPYRIEAVTHLTNMGAKLKPKKIPFNPFL